MAKNLASIRGFAKSRNLTASLIYRTDPACTVTNICFFV